MAAFYKAVLTLLSCLMLASGCTRKANVAAPSIGLQPQIKIEEAPKIPTDGKELWYRELFVPQDVSTTERKQESEFENKIIYARAQTFVEAIKARIENDRPANSVWLLYALELKNHPNPARNVLLFEATLSWQPLYIPRTSISFERAYFEQCLTRLAAQSGLVYNSKKLVNPEITLTKENISVYETIAALLEPHELTATYGGVNAVVRLSLDAFSTRVEFEEALLEAVNREGQALARKSRVVYVHPKSKTDLKEDTTHKQREEKSIFRLGAASKN